MAKKIRVWDGTSWQQVGISAALPSGFNVIIAGNTTLEACIRKWIKNKW